MKCIKCGKEINYNEWQEAVEWMFLFNNLLDSHKMKYICKDCIKT